MNRIKKNYIAFRIAVLLSLLILVMSFSFSVGAVSNNESGKCGENVTWSLTGENGNLTLQITGNGAMYNYSQKSGNSNNTPWNVYKDYITNVIIHNGVTTIGDEAFSFCKKLKNVTIANSVLEIGHHAFQFCDGVSTISIPESVEKIGDGAFYACGELNDIVVTPNNRFYSSQEGVLFNKGKTSLISCPGKKSGEYVVPSGVIKISDLAFGGCSQLTSIVIPDSVSNIGSYAFYCCYFVRNLRIPDGVKTIKPNTFTCCGLKELALPESITSIESEAFSIGSIEKILIPKSVVFIGENAFYNDTVTIYGEAGSCAQTYAEDNGIPFKHLSDWEREVGTPIKSLALDKTELALVVGSSITLKPTLIDITGTVKWSSSDSSVATVSSSGKVTAKKAGTATITAKVGSYKATCKVTVSTSKINNKRSEVKITSKVNGHVLSSKYCDSFFDSYSTKTTCVTENNSLLKISALGAASTYSCTSISTKNFLEKCGFTYNKKFTGSGNSSSLTQNDNCIIYTGEKRVNVLSPTAESKRTIAIVISGYSKNGYEWISNFNIGLGNVHSGFSKAANKVIEYIDNEYKPRKNDIIWIMGHSRGAAITNLVADHYITNGFKNIYAYGFATPNVSTKTKKTNRILNIINSGDFVPYVPLSNWGYSKNGTNRTFTMNSDMKELFKAYTGKSVYKGMSKKENSELLNHFNIICNGSKSGYFVTIKPSSIQGIKLISPKLYMQSGVALLMNDKESVKNTGKTLMGGYSVYSHSYAYLTSHLALEQAVNPKIFDAHCMETYLAIVNGAVPSV